MDEFKRYVAKQNSFLIYGKTKLYEISITWIEKKKCYMLHVDKDYFCKNSEAVCRKRVFAGNTGHICHCACTAVSRKEVLH